MATFDWGKQRADLVRYNRVEGISVGVRGAVRFGPRAAPLSVALTGRLGTADVAPRATLAFTRETPSGSLILSAYRELRPLEEAGRPLGVGNSVTALLFGRDDGDYYGATGAEVAWTPPVIARRGYRVRLYAERQRAASRETDGSVLGWIGWDTGFRPQPVAEPADQMGIELTWWPRWGEDPSQPSVQVDVHVQAERGDHDFERARVTLSGQLPLPLRSGLAAEAGVGTSRGPAPLQRLWWLGGPATLRGFAPGVLAGRSFLRGRLELFHDLTTLPWARATSLVAFADGAWAGERRRIRWADAVASAGIGLRLLGGVLRLEAAWEWKGPAARRLDLYVDGLP